MNNRQAVMLIVAGAVAAALGAATGYYWKTQARDDTLAATDAAAQDAAPETLPAFVLYDLDGQPVSKDALLKEDKALLFNFWATWCAPCREEIPLLKEMQEKYRDRLVIVGVAVDEREKVREFVKKLGGINYPVLLGKQELQAIETANAMGIDMIGLPISVTAGRDGRIREIHTGEVDRAEVTALIEGAL